MRHVLEEFTTVVVGSWNPGIFSPEWTSRHLFSGEPVELEVGFLPGAIFTRFRSKQILVVPARRRLTVAPIEAASNWSAAAQVATKALTTLEHTPVTAVGINFGFLASADGISDRVQQTFELCDDPWLIRSGCVVRNREVKRNMVHDDRTLNLRIEQRENNDTALFLNYHSDVQSPAQAVEWVDKAIADDLLSKAVSLLKSSYSLEYANGNDSDA